MQFRLKPITSSRSVRRRRAGLGAWYVRIGTALVSDRARFIAFAFLVLAVTLMGGGSRSDIQSLVVLRPAAVLFSAYALFLITAEQLREMRAPLLVLLALMLLALLQLLPLPSPIWSSLPQREAVAEVSVLLGMDGIARPLSLDPSRTWNTFFSLFVPLAAICLVAIQALNYRRFVIPMLMAVGLLSAVLGFLQAVGGNGLYLYDITHRGYPVGLFANKNHQSILLLWLMLAASWLAAGADPRRHSANAAIGGALALILVLFPLLVLTGSRAGLLLSVPTLALSAWLLFRAPAMEHVRRRAAGRARFVAVGIAMILVGPLLFVFGVLAISGRQTALSRLFELEAAEDLRWSYLPIFQKMALDYLPFGSGFGSFEKVFNMYEPAGTLTSRYMNQAHNDPLQIVIEGGLPAVAVAIVALVWLVRTVCRLCRSGRDGMLAGIFFGGSIALWLAASLVDYPLRTPIAGMLIAALTAQFCFRSSGIRSSPNGRPAPDDHAEARSE